MPFVFPTRHKGLVDLRGFADRQTDGWADICSSTVAFDTEKMTDIQIRLLIFIKFITENQSQC